MLISSNIFAKIIKFIFKHLTFFFNSNDFKIFTSIVLNKTRKYENTKNKFKLRLDEILSYYLKTRLINSITYIAKFQLNKETFQPVPAVL